MARGPTNATIIVENRKVVNLATPAELLYNYHQALFKAMGDKATNDSFSDKDKNAIVQAALDALGVNTSVGLPLSAENFFTKIKGIRSPIPRTVPTLDGKLITWEEFDDFIEKYAKNPILMQRLGLDSNTDQASTPALTASQVSARISNKIGKRTAGSNKAKKVIDRIPDSNLLNYSLNKTQFPANVTEFFKQEVLKLIYSTNMPMQYKPTGTAFGMILNIVEPNGDIIERHYIKQSFNPAPTDEYDGPSLVSKSISFVPIDIIPFASYATDANGDWSARELQLITESEQVDDSSTDYIFYDIGHKIGDATERLKRQLTVLEQLYTREKIPQIKEGYAAKIARHKEFIRQAELLDQSEIIADNDLGNLTSLEILQIQKELLKTAGTVNVLTVSRETLQDGSKGGLIFSTNVEISITNSPKLNEYMVEFASFNRLKGGKARAIVDAAMRSLLMPRSTSPATLLLHKELAKIFDSEDLLNVARSKSRRNRVTKTNRKEKIFTPKKVVVNSAKAREAEIRAKKSFNKLKVLPSNRRNISNKLNNYNSLVSLLNSNIRDFVIAEMNYPALQNKSGRFASSVKVLSVENLSSLEATIRYTYLKSPYMVFSTSKGKSPWNSIKQRDPATIIDAAIKKMGAKFINNIVLRTEER